MERLAGAGEWEALGLDAPAAPRGEFQPTTVDDFLHS